MFSLVKDIFCRCLQMFKVMDTNIIPHIHKKMKLFSQVCVFCKLKIFLLENLLKMIIESGRWVS